MILHDHPWPSNTILLPGYEYREYVPRNVSEWVLQGDRNVTAIHHVGPKTIYRPAEYIHRIELINEKPVRSIMFVNFRSREWGFWCKHGFVGAENYLDRKLRCRRPQHYPPTPPLIVVAKRA